MVWLRRLLVSGSLGVLFVFALMLSGSEGEIGPRLTPYARTLTIAAGLAMGILLALLVERVWGLVRDLRHGAPGSGLRLRLLGLLLVLALPPWLLLFGFSLRMVDAALDSWFSVDVEQALDGALEIARGGLESELNQALKQTRRLAEDELLVEDLENAIDQVQGLELTVLDRDGEVLASSAGDPQFLLPQPPGSAVLERARGTGMAQYNSVAARPHLEAVAPRPGGGWLQARFALGSDWLAQSARIETEAARFRSLKYLRGALKTTIGLVLGVVLLLGLLLTFFLAFAVARRLVTPISELILSARRIGAGDYAARVPERTGSELGALGSAFNRMGAELEQARAGLQQAVRTAEARRGSLALVQERMSSGLLTLDADGAISALNGAGAQRLGVEPDAIEGLQPEALGQHWPALAQFARVLAEARGRAAREWLAEVNVQRDDGASQPLLLRGAHLPEPVGGMVVLFDDLGEVGRAQRETAWREVARRLAHEIKNPLTPIQLAAERLRRRCMDKLPPEDREVLDKATTTIVAQVEALKTMVNAFSDYAQAPQLTLRRLDPDALVREVVGLYESGAGQVHFTLALAAEGEVRIEGDAGRLRQLLHNLIRNAEEAAAPRAVGLHIVSRHLREGERAWYELQLRDDGPGIPEQLLDRLFEPYVTSKPKGTGLGLAIVRRIAEEHGGNIRAWNHAEGGAVLTVRLPLAATEALAKPS